MSQADRDMQSFIDQQQKLSSKTMLPFMMLTEEMYRANFILDKWLNRK